MGTKFNSVRNLPFFVLIPTIICAFAPLALGHKVNIFAYVEGDNIYTESYFSDGRPVQGGKIEILNSEGIRVLEGTTDEEGKFSAPVPMGNNDLDVVLNASMGHKSSFLLKRGHSGE